MRDGGKGDAKRPVKNQKEFDKNWDDIFKTPKKQYEERLKSVLQDNPKRNKNEI
jgi:hypothetical protein